VCEFVSITVLLKLVCTVECAARCSFADACKYILRHCCAFSKTFCAKSCSSGIVLVLFIVINLLHWW